MPDDSSGLTPRERRALRAKKESRKKIPKQSMKHVAIAVAALLVVAGIVWAYNTFQPEGPVHEHASFTMFVDDEHIDFSHPRFDLQFTQFVRAHLHVQEQPRYILHVEGSPPRPNLARFFESLEIDATPDRVRLNAAVHDGRLVENNQTHRWQLWVDPCADGPDTWRIQNALFGYVPTHHDRMLIAFAPQDATAESLQGLMAIVPDHETISRTGNDACGGGPRVASVGGALAILAVPATRALRVRSA